MIQCVALFVGYLVLAGGTLRAASTPAPARDAEIKKRAAAYAHGTLEELKLDPLDGIDRREAGRIAEWRILGEVQLNWSRQKVVSFSDPVSDGLNWRIDVISESAAVGPLFVSKISGRQFGQGWGNSSGGPSVDLGVAGVWINDNGHPPRATVTLHRFSQPGDEAARSQLERCIEQVVARMNAAQESVVAPISPSDIRVIESRAIVEFAKPGDPDRRWVAEITLRPRQPPTP